MIIHVFHATPEPEPAAPPLVIEAGRCYRTRYGEKATILKTGAAHPTYPVIGTILEDPEELEGGHKEISRQWTDTGKYYQYPNIESLHDIVDYWHDKPVFDFDTVPEYHNAVVMDPSGEWASFETPPVWSAQQQDWLATEGPSIAAITTPNISTSAPRWCRIHPSFAPRYDGPAEHSLILRPGYVPH